MILFQMDLDGDAKGARPQSPSGMAIFLPSLRSLYRSG